MKIQSLKLRGFLGIQKGLGLDEISLDLSGVSGLVAFDGPNGMGKSTILENLHGYPQLASRKKALQHHTFLRDSYRDLTFTFQGDEIRTLIKIDSQSEKTEGFAWVNGQPKIDGKISNYKAFMKDLLGSPELFFNSVFSSQNGIKISDMTTGELKGLFAEFLQLHKLEAYETTSKQAGIILSGHKTALERNIEDLQAAIKEKEDIQKRTNETDYHRKEAGDTLLKLKGHLTAAEKQIEGLREKGAKNAVLQARLVDYSKAKGEVETQIKETQEKQATELGDLRDKAIKASTEIKNLESVLGQKTEILAAVQKQKELNAEIDGITPKMEILQGEISQIATTINDLDKVLTKTRGDMKSLKEDNKGTVLALEIATLKDQTATLTQKDPICQSTTCSFITKALAAKKLIPGKEQELKAHRNLIETKVEDLTRQISNLEKEVFILGVKKIGHEAALNTLKDHVSSKQKEIKDLGALAAQAPRVEIAETRLTDLTASKQELIEKGIALKNTFEQTITKRQTDLAAIDGLIETTKALIDDNIDQNLADALATIESLKADIVQKETDIQQINEKLAVLLQKLKEIELKEKDLKAHKARRIVLTEEISEWSYLKDACGKNGLQALEIDSVAPVITGYANDLLTRTFGPMFSVRFRTQNDDGREVLDILVIRDDGSEVLLDNLSGGEKVWNLKALRLAMTLVSKEKSGKNYLSSFADEEDGALDVENAMNFVSLYRSFMASGGFETCFFITHKPECVTMADHVIRFTGKGVEVE